VNGPIYSNIVLGKDLVADILPPPQYIIETYLVAHRLCATQAPEQRQRLEERLSSLRQEFDERHAFWDTALPPGELRSALVEDAYVPALAFYKLLDDRFLPAVRSGRRDQAQALTDGDLLSLYERHRQAVDRAVTLASAYATAQEESAKRWERGGYAALAGIVGLVALACGGVAWLVARSICRRLAQVNGSLQALLRGDTAVRLEVDGMRELAQLSEAVNRLLDEHAAELAQRSRKAQLVTQAASQLDTHLGQIAGTFRATTDQAASASADAAQVSSAIAGTAASAEEMSASIREIASAASETTRVVVEATGMAKTADGTVARLSEAGQQIGEVVQAIAAIAAQTNLLALNATIEAARAGEAGRGFAVVANEVKNLAQKTTRAVGKVGQRIEGIRIGCAAAASDLGNMAAIISRISELQAMAGAAVEQQSATTAEMARRSEEAARGAQRIAATADAVARSVGGAAHGVEGLRAAANALVSTSDALTRSAT
jgi:methyl-accepting chemotaxis protein